MGVALDVAVAEEFQERSNGLPGTNAKRVKEKDEYIPACIQTSGRALDLLPSGRPS